MTNNVKNQIDDNLSNQEKSVKKSYFCKKTLLSELNVVNYIQYCCSDYQIEGKDIVILNPHRSDENLGSLRICISGEKCGYFHDFADQSFKGKNMIDFTMQYFNMSFKEAIQHIHQYLYGERLTFNERKSFNDPVHHIKLVDHKKDIVKKFVGNIFNQKPTEITFKNQKPSHVFTYVDEHNHPIIIMSRFDIENNKKKFIAQSHTEQNSWEFTLPTHNRPLYNLNEIINFKEKPILIVEGEKVADKLKNVLSQFVVTTTLGGANAAEKSDLSLLHDRIIYIWKDNDDAGEIYQKKLVDLLSGHVKSIHVLPEYQFISKHKGYDAVDFINEKSLEELYNLISNFRVIDNVKQQNKTEKDQLIEMIYPRIDHQVYIKEYESLTINNVSSLYLSKSKILPREKAISTAYLQINNQNVKQALILDITYSSYGKSKIDKYNFRKIGYLPEPNLIIKDRHSFAMQYVYFLEQRLYGNSLKYFDQLADNIAKLAGSCKEKKDVILPKATVNKDGFMINPITQITRVMHQDTYSLSLMQSIVDSTQAIFYGKENSIFFDFIRKIAYRAVNYTNDLFTFLKEKSDQVKRQLNINLHNAEIDLILQSICQFVAKNKESFVSKKTTLSCHDEIWFNMLTSKERMSEGAKYVARVKHHKMCIKLLKIIKKLSNKISLKELALKTTTSCSNLSQHYSSDIKRMYQILIFKQFMQQLIKVNEILQPISFSLTEKQISIIDSHITET